MSFLINAFDTGFALLGVSTLMDMIVVAKAVNKKLGGKLAEDQWRR